MRVILISILMFLVGSFSAQQTPHYTQYVFNYFALNPAMAGSQKCLDTKLGYRNQWFGYGVTNMPGQGNVNPRTAFANIHGRLKFKKKKTIRTNHGVGLAIDSDRMGYLSRTTLNLAYAYHFPVGRDITASVGLFAGLHQIRLDATKILAANMNDPLLGASGSAFTFPNITPGLFLNHKKWFAGLDIQQVYTAKWKVIGSGKTSDKAQFGLLYGLRKELYNGTVFIPSAYLRLGPYSTPLIDLNALFDVTDNIQLGGTWRNTDGIAAMVKFKFLNFFSLGYSFDFTTSRIRYASSNTHEVIIGIYACPHEGSGVEICPAFQ